MTLKELISWKEGDIEKGRAAGGDLKLDVNVNIIHGSPAELPDVIKSLTRAVNYQKPGTPVSADQTEILWNGYGAVELEDELRALLIRGSKPP
ncbi:MAG: hypothetical protein Q8878_06160 [Bacillota bacterium]|nr:hypothetical protein [Bacillota bacterium]